MKKIALFLMLLAYSASSTAQSTVPVPADPDASRMDWIDHTPYIHDGDGQWKFHTEFEIWLAQSVFGEFVATDYPGNTAEIQAIIAGEELEFTKLDRDKISFSVYTDWDEIFVFNPDEYPEFDVPTTNVPYTIFDGPGGNGTAHFEGGFIHFVNKTNHVDVLAEQGYEMDPFFLWRIGVQAHYTEGDVTTSSNIVYLYIFPKPVTILGDVNEDGFVNISDVIALINYISLGTTNGKFNKFNADYNDDDHINISDVIALINFLSTGA